MLIYHLIFPRLDGHIPGSLPSRFSATGSVHWRTATPGTLAFEFAPAAGRISIGVPPAAIRFISSVSFLPFAETPAAVLGFIEMPPTVTVPLLPFAETPAVVLVSVLMRPVVTVTSQRSTMPKLATILIPPAFIQPAVAEDFPMPPPVVVIVSFEEFGLCGASKGEKCH